MKKFMLLLGAATLLLGACAHDGHYGDRGHGHHDRHDKSSQQHSY